MLRKLARLTRLCRVSVIEGIAAEYIKVCLDVGFELELLELDFLMILTVCCPACHALLDLVNDAVSHHDRRDFVILTVLSQSASNSSRLFAGMTKRMFHRTTTGSNTDIVAYEDVLEGG